MFSGIVKGVGKVLKVTSKKDCISIEILPPRISILVSKRC